MLFNSGVFLFVFLPVAMLGFAFAYRRNGLEGAWLWLAMASVFFYGWWNPVHVPLLLASVCSNYWLGRRLAEPDNGRHRWLLGGGVIVNLGLLGWFKYRDFVASNVAALFGLGWDWQPLELPLGISFYTFHQLTYLLHCRAGRAQGTTFRHYLLYVTFFPQLIAGPIVRPMEMLPQLQEARPKPFRWDQISVGLTLLIMGLFKKMVIADHVARWVSPVFDQSGPVSFLDSWVASISYTLQLYFDFSAYSDMALGLAFVFGVRLPGNFYSPYKARSIIDFWRRWHISLSLFLRDYLYIPLGGNRLGEARRGLNLLLVMVIGGFWHGAGWTFGLWGLWHGVALLVNHHWRKTSLSRAVKGPWVDTATWAITFASVVLGWVLFRSPDVGRAGTVLAAMSGIEGVTLPASYVARLPFLESLGVQAGDTWLVFKSYWQLIQLGLLMGAVLLLPNTLQLMRSHFEPPNVESLPYVKTRWQWRPTRRWAILLGVMLAVALLQLGRVSEFLYFQF